MRYISMEQDSSKFKYLMYVLDESCKGRIVAGTIRPLFNTKGLPLGCTWVLHDGLIMPILLYSSETMR